MNHSDIKLAGRVASNIMLFALGMLVAIMGMSWQKNSHDQAVKEDLDRMEQCLIKESVQ